MCSSSHRSSSTLVAVFLLSFLAKKSGDVKELRIGVKSSEQAAKRAKKSLQALIAAAFRNENEGLRIVEENSDINTNEKRKKMTTTKEKRKEVRIDESDFFNLLNNIQRGKDAPNDKGMEVRVPKDKEDEARITKDKREKMRISKEKRKEVRIDESDFFNLLNDINLGEDLSNRKKKGRGPTKLLGANIISGENPRLKVEWNERGHPVGKNSEKFVSLLGVIAKEMVPLNKPSWTKVNMGIKNTIWLLLLGFKQERRKLGFDMRRGTLRQGCWMIDVKRNT
ncbi:hypothetical protein Sjap_003432 [Stephania japonica]|uniref:Uncharacterized protein n=1 Tax=Stephania japonica TaxID=461633 RepID=A0AAP0KNR3_9MAGN